MTTLRWVMLIHADYHFVAHAPVLPCDVARDDTPPKSEPDEDTLGARWVALDELDQYPLRGQEVRELFEYVARGGAVYPLSLLQAEGAPW